MYVRTYIIHNNYIIASWKVLTVTMMKSLYKLNSLVHVKIKNFKNLKSKEGLKLQKVREQGIRFWNERTFWHEIILKV